jgi:lipid-binding SYLF domain-containing protein
MTLKKIAAVLCLVACAATTTWGFWEKSPAQERSEIQEMAGQTLNELYNLRPSARDYIHRSVGYAVFSTKGMKILIAGGTSGKGVLVERETGKKIYMKMAQANVGLGVGLEDARFVFVFEDRAAMDNFATQGWDFSGQAGVTAAQKGQGANAAGALSFMPGVMAYQFTKNGLSVELTVQGTKFWAEKKWNE